MAIINLSFVVLAASDKIMWLTGLPARVIVPLIIPLAIIIVLSIGWLLDRISFVQAYLQETNRRNEMLSDVYKKVSNHENNESNW